MTTNPNIAPLLKDTLIEAWDDVVARHGQGIVAAPKGKAHSVEDFISQLRPIRHELKDCAQGRLEQILCYAALKIRLADFWQRSPKGARFTEYIWMYAAGAKDKTLGRLQITFCPDGMVRSEYVSYPKSDQGRTYHIEQLSLLMQDSQWFGEFKRGCLALQDGFLLQCMTGNGVQITADIRRISATQWAALNTHGLDQKQYFVIAMDRHRDFLRHMTADELAELLVGDWEDLGTLWGLLQGLSKSLAILPVRTVSPIVEATRRLATPALDSFSPESQGPRAPYTISNPIRANRLHAMVVNALSKELEHCGHRVANDQARDLTVLRSDGRVEILFEVKTDSSTFSIYSGVGQLLLHGAAETPEPRRVLVLPVAVNKKLGNALQKIGLHVLLYSFQGKDNIPAFESLTDVVGNLK
jgi:hypothetical protein